MVVMFSHPRFVGNDKNSILERAAVYAGMQTLHDGGVMAVREEQKG